jgi:hypothetical protein
MYHQLSRPALVLLFSSACLTRTAESTSQLRSSDANSVNRNLGLWYSLTEPPEEGEEPDSRTVPQLPTVPPLPTVQHPGTQQLKQNGGVWYSVAPETEPDSEQDTEETRADDTKPSGHDTEGFWYSLPRPEQETIDTRLKKSVSPTGSPGTHLDLPRPLDIFASS